MSDQNFNPIPHPLAHSGSAQGGASPSAMEGQMDLQKFSHALLVKSWIVALCLLACLGLAFAYLRHAAVLYTATATILVEQQQQDVVKFVNNQQSEDLRSLEVLQTIAQNLTSQPVLQRVANSNWLVLASAFPSVSNAPALPAPMGASNILAPQTRLDIFNALAAQNQMIQALFKVIDVKLRRGTRLIDVTVRHPSPAVAALIANSVVNENISEMGTRYSSVYQQANEFLVAESERLRLKLQDSETQMQRYLDTCAEPYLVIKSISVSNTLTGIGSQLLDAKWARLKAESDYAQVERLGTNVESLLTLGVIAANPLVLAAQNNLTQGELAFAAVRDRYMAKHPKYQQMVSQARELRAAFTSAVFKAVESLKASVASARKAGKDLEETFAAEQAVAVELGKLAGPYAVLAREVDSDRSLYDSILMRMKETAITKEANPNRISIVQVALPPNQPSSPKKLLILAAAVLAGIFSGAFLVIGLTAMDSSVMTVDEIEALLHSSVLAAIPQIKEVLKGHEVVVVEEDAKSAGAEAFRSLRTAVSMLGRAEDHRVFMFTSALPAEGKTFCSINFAASLAQLGLKTLLIDCDLRRPSVENTLKHEEHEKKASAGVTDCLTGQKTLDEVVQPTKLEKFFFVSGGTTAPNPAELVAGTGLKGLLEEALQKYDRVVLDSAPVHAVSDTLLLARHVQTICLVVRAGRTPRRAITRCVQALQGAGAPLAGVVLNRMARRRSLGYGYYYDSYYDYAYHGKYAKKGVYGSK